MSQLNEMYSKHKYTDTKIAIGKNVNILYFGAKLSIGSVNLDLLRYLS